MVWQWVSEVENLGWGISHVGDRLGGNIQGYKRYRLPDDENEYQHVTRCAARYRMNDRFSPFSWTSGKHLTLDADCIMVENQSDEF